MPLCPPGHGRGKRCPDDDAGAGGAESVASRREINEHPASGWHGGVSSPVMPEPPAATSTETAASSPARPGALRFAPRAHYRLAYEVVAPAPSTGEAAPVVVLLHDLLAGRGEWAAVREALAAAGFGVILPEARGHGASAGLADRRYAAADMAAEVVAVLDAAGLGAIHLVGHGLGGAAALAVARAYPDRVRALALVAPAVPSVLDGDPDPALVSARNAARRADQATAEAAYKGLTDRALDGYLDPRWGTGWRERLPRPRLAATRRHAAALAGTLPALDGFAVDRGAVGAVAVPTLVVQREGASPVVGASGERLVSWLPAARLAAIPAGPTTDDPLGGEAGAALADLLVAFVEEQCG